MNTREKILHHLETNKPTSSREFHTLTGAPKSRITQLLRELTESGQLEIYSAHNGIKRYRLTELHASRRKSVLDYLEAGNEGASSDIAAATGLEVQVTSQILASLCKQGGGAPAMAGPSESVALQQERTVHLWHGQPS
ncbi:MarR family [Leclercia adecarboxylata]|uniref:MarR family n=1 Tax=Leclercia adecarboxylata TaxID=83655 RepID=A0A4U9I152_9ENTR|nr:MarR family [Leclercia adecarboxylata]